MSETLQSLRGEPVRQFSIFADNKVGRLHELVVLLAARDVHLMALSIQDNTDASMLRLIVDYPEVARDLLHEKGYAFSEIPMVAVEIESEEKVKYVTAALVEVEMNIHYCYPFIMRPGGKSAIALRVEDPDLAESVFSAHGIRTLTQADIAR